MSNPLTIKEIEGLGYYDFMGYMGIPFFNIGGFASIDRLAELCKITEHTKILEVGCGTGANACYLAKTYRCSVVGIDVAEYMVKYAQKRASDLDLNNRVSFKVGDAYNLEFQDKEFDLVLTIFVSQFLEPARVFPEFFRVLKVNGYLGVNEMYKTDDIPDEASQRVNYGERVFRELTELPFTIKSPVSWRLAFESAGFSDILLEERSNASEKPYANSVSEFGGYISLISTLWKTLVFALKSGKIRKRFGKISKVKGVLLQDKLTSKYMGYLLCVGRKPLIYPK